MHHVRRVRCGSTVIPRYAVPVEQHRHPPRNVVKVETPRHRGFFRQNLDPHRLPDQLGWQFLGQVYLFQPKPLAGEHDLAGRGHWTRIG